MKLYRVMWADPQLGTMQIWERTKADAERRAKELCKTDNASPIIQGEDIPTDKRGLQMWLNANCTFEAPHPHVDLEMGPIVIREENDAI
jgi:hypothetical protein